MKLEINKYELFKKAGGRLALSLYVLLHNASAKLRGGGGGGAGDTCPHPPRRGRGECPKKNSRIYMYGNGLVVFGVFWGGLGYFKAVGFQKRI